MELHVKLKMVGPRTNGARNQLVTFSHIKARLLVALHLAYSLIASVAVSTSSVLVGTMRFLKIGKA